MQRKWLAPDTLSIGLLIVGSWPSCLQTTPRWNELNFPDTIIWYILKWYVLSFWMQLHKRLSFLWFQIAHYYVRKHLDRDTLNCNLQVSVAYPKAGTPNPVVKLRVVDLSTASLDEFVVDAPIAEIGEWDIFFIQDIAWCSGLEYIM